MLKTTNRARNSYSKPAHPALLRATLLEPLPGLRSEGRGLEAHLAALEPEIPGPPRQTTGAQGVQNVELSPNSATVFTQLGHQFSSVWAARPNWWERNCWVQWNQLARLVWITNTAFFEWVIFHDFEWVNSGGDHSCGPLVINEWFWTPKCSIYRIFVSHMNLAKSIQLGSTALCEQHLRQPLEIQRLQTPWVVSTSIINDLWSRHSGRKG